MGRKKLLPATYEWKANLAYAMGVLVTDGNLSPNGRTITLRCVDEEMVVHFKHCLGASQRIFITKEHLRRGGNRHPIYQIQIGNVGLYRWLLTIGFSPKKTLTIGAIEIPDKFFRDFLRGHLDGDGTITVYRDRYNTKKHPSYIYMRVFTRFISASEKHLTWLRENISRLTGLRGDFSHRIMKSGNTMWTLKFMKKESLRLFDWIYYSPTVPCLTRKRERAERAAAIAKIVQRKPYVRSGIFTKS